MKALAVAALSFLVGTAVAAEAVKPDAKQVFDTWKAGYAAKDVDKVMSIYSQDLKFSFQGLADTDYEGLRSWYVADFADPNSNFAWTSVLEETHSDSNLAVFVSSWTSFTQPAIGPPRVVQKIRSIDMLRLTPDGWKIFRTINYPETSPQ